MSHVVLVVCSKKMEVGNKHYCYFASGNMKVTREWLCFSPNLCDIWHYPSQRCQCGALLLKIENVKKIILDNLTGRLNGPAFLAVENECAKQLNIDDVCERILFVHLFAV